MRLRGHVHVRWRMHAYEHVQASVSTRGRPVCVDDAPACVCGCTADPAVTQEPIFVRAVGISFPGPPDPLESDLLVFIVQTTVDLDGARPSIYKRLT